MRWMTLLAVTAVLALAGCGGSDEKSSGSSSSSSSSNSSASSGGGGETLKLAADKSALKFDKSSLTAKAGKVTLEMANPSRSRTRSRSRATASTSTARRSATARPRRPPPT